LAAERTAAASAAAGESAPAVEVAAARRYHPLRWVIALALAWCIFQLLQAFATTPNIDWGTVGDYLFDREVLRGLGQTLLLTAVAMGLATVLGVVIAVMRLSSNPVARGIAVGYVWIMRSIPVLVQLILWYNLALVFDEIKLGIPGTGLTLATWQTNTVVTPFMTAVLGLGLAEAAYYSEIVRGGLLGINKGQHEAARALGMTGFQTFRLVVLPQAMRIIIPPTGNELIGMLKYTALASVISYTELLGTATQIYGQNAKTMELLLVISIWYIICTTALSVVQYFVERHYGRGHAAVKSRRPRGIRTNLAHWPTGRGPA
jgi:polar amino acid transport system permease protein